MNTKSAIIIGLSIIIGFAVFSLSLNKLSAQLDDTPPKYEFHRVNDRNFVIMDIQTGQCWRRDIFENKKWEGKAPQ